MCLHVGNIKSLIKCFSNIRKSITPVVKGVNIRPPMFQSFSLTDLERLKSNDKWLTDSHVTFGLLYVPIFFFVIILNNLVFTLPGTVIEIPPGKTFGGTSR